jgi:hypothetical protein
MHGLDLRLGMAHNFDIVNAYLGSSSPRWPRSFDPECQLPEGE